jgi:hypothetical protein
MKTLIACVALAAVALGCGSTKSSKSDLDAWEREVGIISTSEIGDRQYEELGGLLEEREPIRTAYGSEETAIDSAKRRLRRKAAELDADAVVIIECGRDVRPMEETFGPGTGPEIICHGVAIRWLD